MWNLNKIKQFSSFQKAIVIFIQSLLYAPAFFFTYQFTRNGIVTVIEFIPMVLISWFWGRAAGVGVVITNMTWTIIIILLFFPGPPQPLSLPALLGIIVHTSFALIVGTFSSLTSKLRIENAQKEDAQLQLKEYQNHLEEIVQNRTKELQLVNERLRQVEKMEAIGQLAGGIAHDFNNQLTIVLGYCELLSNRLADKPQFLEYLQQIHSSGKRASDLTKQLLAFARKGVYKQQVVNIHEIIQEVITLLSRSINKNITIKHVLNSKKPFIWGGPTQLQNALLNLSLNSRDAMENGGILTFETNDILINNEFCVNNGCNLPDGSYISIAINDTGCGMDAEILKHIFEPFFTTKEEGKGTGMGLAAVYGIVNSHKGSILVQSTPKAGSTFTLLLPLTSKPERPKTKTIPAVKNYHGDHILVIDDEQAVAKTIKDMLTGFGFVVSLCYSGKDALEIYHANQATISLVIIDMVMPDIDGRETFLKLKEINPSISAIISSGFALTKEIELTLRAGAKAFLQKPYNQNDLITQIDKLLPKKEIQAVTIS